MLQSVRVMGELEARQCLDRIRAGLISVATEVRRFHDGEGWRALGYLTFEECVGRELGISKQHGYRLLEASHIREELAHSLPASNIDVTSFQPSDTQLLELLPLPANRRVEIARQVDFSTKTVRELRQIVREAKATLDIKVQETRAEQPPLPRPSVPALPQDVRIEVADAGEMPLSDDSIDLIVTSPPYGLFDAEGEE
jgi:hypothetical protein